MSQWINDSVLFPDHPLHGFARLAEPVKRGDKNRQPLQVRQVVRGPHQEGNPPAPQHQAKEGAGPAKTRFTGFGKKLLHVFTHRSSFSVAAAPQVVPACPSHMAVPGLVNYE